MGVLTVSIPYNPVLRAASKLTLPPRLRNLRKGFGTQIPVLHRAMQAESPALHSCIQKSNPHEISLQFPWRLVTRWTLFVLVLVGRGGCWSRVGLVD